MNSEENIFARFRLGTISFEINDAEKICCNFTTKIRDLVIKSKQRMSSEQLQTFKKEVDDTVNYLFKFLSNVEFFTYEYKGIISQREKHVNELRIMYSVLNCWLKREKGKKIQYIKQRLKKIENLFPELEWVIGHLNFIYYANTYEDILY